MIRADATLSLGVWLASVPFARSTLSNPCAISAFASLPPPVAVSRGSIPHRRQRLPGEPHRPRARREAIAAEHLDHVHVHVAPDLGRRPGAGVDDAGRRLRRLRLVDAPRLRLDPALAPRPRSRPCRPGSRRRSRSSPRRDGPAASRSPRARRPRSRCGRPRAGCRNGPRFPRTRPRPGCRSALR